MYIALNIFAYYLYTTLLPPLGMPMTTPSSSFKLRNGLQVKLDNFATYFVEMAIRNDMLLFFISSEGRKSIRTDLMNRESSNTVMFL